jgi:ankyrin repeat protein
MYDWIKKKMMSSLLFPLFLLPLYLRLVRSQTTMHYADMNPAEKIIVSSKEGNINGIREAITSGVNVDLKSLDYGMTALHYVANGGYTACAKYLVEIGSADMDLKDNDGQTALMLASTRQASVEVAKLLITLGADIDLTDNNGMTALMWATTHRVEKVARALLQNKASQEIIASDGQNALQKAEQRRSDGPLGDAIQNMLKYDVGYFSMFNL